MFFFFGLRKSELRGTKQNCVDLSNGVLSIKAVYIDREGGLKKRTKNRGSFRDIDLDDKQIKFFEWWLSKLATYKPDNDYLFPASRGDGPISTAGMQDIMWSTYAEYGLAEIKKHNGHITVLSSPLKNAATKTFRHRLAHLLIEALDSEKAITRNYVKHTLGHTRFTTSQDIYGNHKPKIVKAKTDAKALALGYDKFL